MTALEHTVLVLGDESDGLRVEFLESGAVLVLVCRPDRIGAVRVEDPKDVERLGVRLVSHGRAGTKARQSSSPSLDVSVDCLDLSVRAGNVLVLARILTLGDLVRRTASELARLKNSSAKVAREILAELAKLRLYPASEPSP